MSLPKPFAIRCLGSEGKEVEGTHCPHADQEKNRGRHLRRLGKLNVKRSSWVAIGQSFHVSLETWRDNTTAKQLWEALNSLLNILNGIAHDYGKPYIPTSNHYIPIINQSGSPPLKHVTPWHPWNGTRLFIGQAWEIYSTSRKELESVLCHQMSGG